MNSVGRSNVSSLIRLVQILNVKEKSNRSLVSWTRQTGTLLSNDISTGGSLRHRSKGRDIGETSTLQQEGHEIQEVPLAVINRRANDSLEGDFSTKGSENLSKPYIDLDPREEAAFVDGFNSYHTPQEVLKMLDTIPSQEVTPFVSLSILKKLFELENNFVYRNDGRSWVISTENSTIETFARMAIVSRLIDTIVSSSEPDIILDALDVIRSERVSGTNGEEVDDHGQLLYGDISNYRNKFFEEILVRITQGKLTLSQVCRAIVSLGKLEIERRQPLQHDFIDKLWVGVLEKSGDIGVDNIVDVFRVVQYFKKSRRLVLILAEKKLLTLWWKLESKQVAEICSILISEERNALLVPNGGQNERNTSKDSWGISHRLLSALARCASLNVHQVTEEELLKIVRTFNVMNFYDESIEKALNKYMKTKCLKITNPYLISTIMEYTTRFRIRSAHILESAAEFVIVNKNSITIPHITPIVTTFGHLDFQPPNGTKFWQTIETLLDEKFIQFPPKDILQILLSCIYLLKFPLNFVDRMFSPYFLDRLHTSEKDYVLLQNMRSNLKLLDSALTIECPTKYNGPMLPKDFTSRSVFVDGRVQRMAIHIVDILNNTIQPNPMLGKNFVLPNLPLNAHYIADILIGSGKGLITDTENYNHIRNRISGRLNSGVTSKDNPRNLTIMLIHLPEHYSSDGLNLIGPQIMRTRQLKALGFYVASLNYKKLCELKVHPEEFKEYMKEMLKTAGYFIR